MTKRRRRDGELGRRDVDHKMGQQIGKMKMGMKRLQSQTTENSTQ